jgi:hypothetical protein
MSNDKQIDPHEFGENAIRELSTHLYKYPKSAVKEAITNGLDEQAGKPKEAKIDITTHVGPDDDLWIEDPATGIKDYKKFKTVLRGYKEVGGRLSSYGDIDEDIGGNKGLGKLGFLMLAGGEIPTVEFWSHRPRIGEIKAQGMKVTMTEKGFEVEYMDTLEALPHPGVRVVIKHCKWELLPKETDLIKYIAKMFAIRIARGTKIFIDGNKISAPEAFNSKAEDLFSLSDGSIIKGNIRTDDNPEHKNMQIFNKNIFVDEFWTEHKATGWINDNFIIPTSSREGIEETARWLEIRQGLMQYLDENYEKPSSLKIDRMGKEKEKMNMYLKALQLRDRLLAGIYNKEGIEGEITGGQPEIKKPLIKKPDVKLTNTGSEDGEPVIPIGPGTRGKGPRTGGTGTKPGFEENGDHEILITPPATNEQKERTGKIIPNIIQNIRPFGSNKEMMFLTDNGMTMNWNTYWPQTVRAHKASGPDYKYVIAPVYAQALTNLDNETIDKMDLTKWQLRYQEYMKFLVE